MSRTLSYSTDARADLRDLSDFIFDQSGSEDGESFVVQIDQRCRRLVSLDGILGTARPELSEGLRSTPHKGYVTFFRYLGAVLENVNILHGNRDLITHFGGDPTE